MSVKPIKALYLATNLDALEGNIYKKMEGFQSPSVSAKKCCGHADTLFIAAGEAMRSGDEERAYVLYMKYMEMLKIVRRKPEYKKDEKFFDSLIGLKKFEQALSACERLQTALKKRYTLKMEEEEALKLIEKQEKQEKAEKAEKSKRTSGASSFAKPGSHSEATSKRPSKQASDSADSDDSRAISCMALNSLLKQESSSFLIVDVRPAADFSASRLASRFVVNVPAELVRPGVTAPALEAQLPEPSRQLFARRRTVDRLVLIDWTGRDEADASLVTLRDAMVKWDVAAYRARPEALVGGYQMWLHTYPMLTTNPQARAPTADVGPAGVPLSFQYPSLDEPSPPQVDRTTRLARPGVPSRALKPQLTDEAAARQRIELSRSRLEAEQDWQAVRRSREQQLETEMRSQLQQKEEILLDEIQRLEREQDAWEGQQADLRAENEALRLRLAAFEPAATVATPTGGAEKHDSEKRLLELQAEQERISEQLEAARHRREQEQEQERERGRRRAEQQEKERLQALDEARRAAEDEAQRKRAAEEAQRKRAAEEDARLRKAAEEKEAAAAEERRRRRAEEEQRRLEEQERRLEEQERRQDQVYRTRLKEDGGSGGGSGLKRSHSSPFIAGLGQEQAAAPSPSFSRDTKPLSRGRRVGDVQAARTRRFAPAFGHVGPALTGLKNLGNTCYMNAVVQCINNTPSLNEFFVREAYQDYMNYDSELSKGEAAQELAAVVKVLWSGHYRSVALYDLKDVMGRHHPRFRGTAQQDAHEFLMYLLEFLHEDLNEVRKKRPLKEQENDGVPDPRAAEVAWDDFLNNNRSYVMNLFWGQHKSTLRCSRCGNQSVKFETFSHLSVPMPSRSGKCSLQECIRLYMAGDTISGWTCPKCKSSIEATKTLYIWRLPPILIIHVQRFYNDGLWRKKQSNVDFPLENLDMAPYVINKEARYRHHRYHLYGVVNHYGSMESGHYTAYCRSITTGRWHKFDDHEVYQMSNGTVQTSAGYILFYSGIDGKM
ncbi:ubiquitin carboxyl-terminal hydrolase 8-like [Pollicipes pollicipes]|uniref:ubiquitin carboxyl-terminal hydrolase 8-like n=1 Tax=Pollicipes pollicipes TaxID=41117 RepID=UPI001884EB36|nr:ubiquitin carboxyl-terminal hydrolase 8-like [Pollicipes pollicipes]